MQSEAQGLQAHNRMMIEGRVGAESDVVGCWPAGGSQYPGAPVEHILTALQQVQRENEGRYYWLKT